MSRECFDKRRFDWMSLTCQFYFFLKMKPSNHILTFNVSVADREFINKSSEPFQIMPARTGWLTDKMIDSYMKNDSNRDILIHTSYITRVFSSKENVDKLLQQYIKLAHRLNTKYILIHGPYSSKELEFFDHGLELLQKLTKNNPDIKFVVEIPAFTKELIKKTDHSIFDRMSRTHHLLDFIDKYIGKIVKAGFEVVIDTAHTFNNCLSNEEVIGLVKAYSESVTWIHFNGNLNVQASKDHHCPMYDKNNLIPEPIKFTQELLKVVKNDTIFISETINNDLKKWLKFCEDTGLKLVEKTVFNAIGDTIK